jgi:hypothetical protein
MKSLQLLQRASFVALLFAAGLSAQNSGNLDETIVLSVTPSEDLTNLYFLYAQGDISRFFQLPTSAGANMTTNFDISGFGLPFPVPGTPFFSVIGLNSTGDVFVAVDQTDAAALISNGTSFDDAFPSYAIGGVGGTPFGEASLVSGMENVNGPDVFGSGGDMLQIFADTPEQQTPQLFKPLNFSGFANSTLVEFSDATAGGTVSLSIQPAGTTATPEPAAGWLLGSAVSAMAGVRTIKRKQGSN